MRPTHEAVAAKIAEIEAEMRRAGLWQSDAQRPPAGPITAAFGAGMMTFQQWLQFVFIPNVRSIIAERGQFPSESSVAAMAVREFDGLSKADRLVDLLGEFDALFE